MQTVVRPPALCAGCPHRGLFYCLSKREKKDHIMITGDIGCYTLGMAAPLNALHSCICMGASISQGHGASIALKDAGKDTKVVSVIGDSTFFHTGVNSLMDAVYNSGSNLSIILDNRITGMTGHQQNPATGKNAKGEEAPAIDIATLVRAIGVKNVVEIDPFEVKDLEKVLREETERDELSVVITKRPCALIVKQPEVPFAVTDKCKNCKMCMKIGCPAIEEKDGRPYIVPDRCVGCGLCETVCPFDAIKITE
jgi:indolepyruvate ferredoxin oxidoreductase alpha subunit